MRVKNIFIFTVGLKGCSPIASVLGIYHKYASRSDVSFIGWYHLTASKPHYEFQEIFTKSGVELVSGYEALEGYAASMHENAKNTEVLDLSLLEGDAGAIILAHGGGAQAGSRSAESVAYAVAAFRDKAKLKMQFRKIVFDVCNMASPIATVKSDQAKFVGIGFYDSADVKSGELRLNFLQAFTAFYGKLTQSSGPVKVAGWDSGVSVFHPQNEYVKGTPAPAEGWTASVSNRELVGALRNGQKFLSNRTSDGEFKHTSYTLALIDKNIRVSLKKVYQYVSVQNEGETGRVILTKLQDWSDKEI